MSGDTIRLDIPKITTSISLFRGAADLMGEVTFDRVASDLSTALPGGSAVAAALDRACGAAAVAGGRCAGRMNGVADFATEAHRFLEAEDADFASLLGTVASR